MNAFVPTDQAALDDLRSRLARFRSVPTIPAAGVPLDSLFLHWRNDFDWREQEKRIAA